MAMSDTALLNSILAASSSQLSMWQDIPDTASQEYTRRAMLGLEERLQDPILASPESTVATILCLMSVEVNTCLSTFLPGLLLTVGLYNSRSVMGHECGSTTTKVSEAGFDGKGIPHSSTLS